MQLSDDSRKTIREALDSARRFIENGVEFGYIQMPDEGLRDSANDTLPLIRAALAEIALDAGEWRPLEDGDYLLECGGSITISGDGLDVADCFDHWATVKASGYRLCQRTPARSESNE